MAESPTSSHSAEVHVNEKGTEARIEAVRTKERIPGQPHYYEKDGLRTYGDNEDHDHEPRVSETVPRSWSMLYNSVR